MNNLVKQNYQTLEAVQEALVAPFPPEFIKELQGFEYVPVERIRQRLITVVGVDAFDISYSDVQHHAEDWITVKCTLTIDFTRWGGRIKKIEQSDGVQVKRSKSGQNQGNMVNLGNDYKSVKSGALSKAAQDFGIGLHIQLAKGSKGNNQQNNRGNNYQNNNGNKNESYEKLRKVVYASEKTIGITDTIKAKLFTTLFPGVNVQQAMKNPTEQQLKTYKDIVQPVSLIIVNANKANVPHNIVLQQLSQMFNRPVSNFTNVLTLATMQTVNDLKNRLENAS